MSARGGSDADVGKSLSLPNLNGGAPWSVYGQADFSVGLVSQGEPDYVW